LSCQITSQGNDIKLGLCEPLSGLDGQSEFAAAVSVVAAKAAAIMADNSLLMECSFVRSVCLFGFAEKYFPVAVLTHHVWRG
jgi:hydrogenase/urease accessory protein HupE